MEEGDAGLGEFLGDITEIRLGIIGTGAIGHDEEATASPSEVGKHRIIEPGIVIATQPMQEIYDTIARVRICLRNHK
jgi:hypothetical protein